MRVWILSLGAALSLAARASSHEAPYAGPVERGSHVGLNVTIDGRPTPLYASADGRRFYVEARAGGRYELQIVNRTGQRVGVELTVDGLNVVSGERDKPGPDRMYILAPWESSTIRGWRTSLDEVRSFTFVDEKRSYAARSGQANGKMGWIEMAVYRERERPRPRADYGWGARDEAQPRAKAENGARRQAPQSPAPAPPAERESDTAAESYPGTGWGEAVEDRVRLVDFEAEPTPVERVTLRYEYRRALVALGVLPDRDRLSQRERGEGGFAKPPRW